MRNDEMVHDEMVRDGAARAEAALGERPVANDEAILDAAPFSRNKVLALVSAGVAAVAGKVFFGDVVNAPPAYATHNICHRLCGKTCCSGCSYGWCGSCTPVTACDPARNRNCWTFCYEGNRTVHTCCDFKQGDYGCTCVSSDGVRC